MKQFKLVIGILLIFFTGMAAGHLGTVAYFKNKIYKQGPPGLHHILRHKITRDLRLTEAQQSECDRIILEAGKNFDAFRQQHHPEVSEIFDECFKKIHAILDPDQQKQLETIKKRLTRKFAGPGSCSPPPCFRNKLLPPPDGE